MKIGHMIHNKYTLILLAPLMVLCLAGCGVHPKEPPMTQLQIREIQSRDFDTDNHKLVMKSMINVLQDDGFIIKNAVSDLGLLSAEKNIDVENSSHVFLITLLEGKHARWEKQEVLEASGNVSEFGSKIRVRMNFQTKVMDNYGCPKDIKTIYDPQMYQEFFEKVSKSIFLQQQDI